MKGKAEESTAALENGLGGEAQVAEEIGLALQVLLATERRSWPIAVVHAFVEPAVRLRQIEFLLSSRGRPLGYATWAFLNDTSEAALISNPMCVLELEEWNEGTQLWIMDFVAPAGRAPSLARRLRERLTSHPSAKWLRRRRSATPCSGAFRQKHRFNG